MQGNTPSSVYLSFATALVSITCTLTMSTQHQDRYNFVKSKGQGRTHGRWSNSNLHSSSPPFKRLNVESLSDGSGHFETDQPSYSLKNNKLNSKSFDLLHYIPDYLKDEKTPRISNKRLLSTISDHLNDVTGMADQKSDSPHETAKQQQQNSYNNIIVDNFLSNAVENGHFSYYKTLKLLNFMNMKRSANNRLDFQKKSLASSISDEFPVRLPLCYFRCDVTSVSHHKSPSERAKHLGHRLSVRRHAIKKAKKNIMSNLDLVFNSLRQRDRQSSKYSYSILGNSDGVNVNKEENDNEINEDDDNDDNDVVDNDNNNDHNNVGIMAENSEGDLYNDNVYTTTNESRGGGDSIVSTDDNDDNNNKMNTLDGAVGGNEGISSRVYNLSRQAKRAREGGSRIMEFLRERAGTVKGRKPLRYTVNPSRLRRPIKSRLNKFQDEIVRRQPLRQPLTHYDYTHNKGSHHYNTCKPDEDGSQPLRCPSNRKICLYDAMICDGHKDCEGGEDESLSLCVLRRWTDKLLKKISVLEKTRTA